MKTDHTRRQILKCLAALPVVGPMLPDVVGSSSTAGAAPVVASDPMICVGYTATAKNSDTLIPGIWRFSTFCQGGMSKESIDRANELPDEGYDVEFNFISKSELDRRVEACRAAFHNMKFDPPLAAMAEAYLTPPV